MVVRGFIQRYGQDYFEIFTSVVKFFIMRIILVFVVYENLEMFQMDVCTAYLNGIITENIFMY